MLLRIPKAQQPILMTEREMDKDPMKKQEGQTLIKTMHLLILESI
jgi:hypothetical protein